MDTLSKSQDPLPWEHLETYEERIEAARKDSEERLLREWKKREEEKNNSLKEPEKESEKMEPQA